MTSGATPWKCHACGAGNDAARTACWICYVSRRAPPPETALPSYRTRDPVPEERSRAVGIVATLLVVVGVGLMFIAPGLGIVFFIVSLPILFLTKPADGRSHPLAIVGTVLGVLASCVIAFFLTCLGAFTLQGADFEDLDVGFVAGLVGAIVTAILLTVWIVRRAIRRSTKHQTWNRTGIWEDV